MNVQDLFKSLNPDDFVDDYVMYCPDIVAGQSSVRQIVAKQSILKAFTRFCKMEIFENPNILVFGVPQFDNDSNADTFYIYKKELERYQKNDAMPDTYAYELNEPAEILGYQVSETSRYLCGDLRLASVIFSEMTFFGYEEEQSKAERESFIAGLNKSINDIKYGKTYSIAEMSDLMGIQDVRKPWEKELDSALYRIESSCAQEKRECIFLAEQQYIQKLATTNHGWV